MKRIIGIPHSRNQKSSTNENEPKSEGEASGQTNGSGHTSSPNSSGIKEKVKHLFFNNKPPPPKLSDLSGKTQEKADELDKKVEVCNAELRKIANQLKQVREGPTKANLKSKALSILQRKKRFEQQAESLRQQSFNMEQTDDSISASKDAVTTYKIMKEGAKELKKQQKKVDIDAVQDLHDELGDLLEQNDEVQNAFADDLRTPVVDDAELEEQLALLSDEFVADKDSSYLDEAEAAAGRKAQSAGARENAALPSLPFDTDEFGLPRVPPNGPGSSFAASSTLPRRTSEPSTIEDLLFHVPDPSRSRPGTGN